MFRHRFPSHYVLQARIVAFLQARLGFANPFGVFTSCAINTGGRVCMSDHTDPDNFWGTFCGVMSFGDTDFRKSAFLIVKAGGVAYHFELPPGVLIFFPSAILLHSNSEIIGSDGYRGSIVYWMSGSVVRWYMLGGRAVCQLSEADKAVWTSSANIQKRRDAILSLYPSVPLPVQ